MTKSGTDNSSKEALELDPQRDTLKADLLVQEQFQLLNWKDSLGIRDMIHNIKFKSFTA